jgi:hypothetical protein
MLNVERDFIRSVMRFLLGAVFWEENAARYLAGM